MSGVFGIPQPLGVVCCMLGSVVMGSSVSALTPLLQFISTTLHIDKSSSRRVGSCLTLLLVSPVAL